MFRGDKGHQVGQAGVFFSSAVPVVPQNQGGSGGVRSVRPAAPHSMPIVPQNQGGLGVSGGPAVVFRPPAPHAQHQVGNPGLIASSSLNVTPTNQGGSGKPKL